MRKYFLFLICIFLSGCASTLTIQYDPEGRVEKLIGKGTQDSTIKQGEIECKMNTKQDFKLVDLNLSKVGT